MVHNGDDEFCAAKQKRSSSCGNAGPHNGDDELCAVHNGDDEFCALSAAQRGR